jgi:hypothetical protein
MRLSTIAQNLTNSLGAHKTDTKQTAQQLAALGPSLLWRIEALEAVISATAAPVDPVPGENADGTIEEALEAALNSATSAPADPVPPDNAKDIPDNAKDIIEEDIMEDEPPPRKITASQ